MTNCQAFGLHEGPPELVALEHGGERAAGFVERQRTRNGKMTEQEAVGSDENVLNLQFTETDAEGQPVEGGIQKDNSLLVKYFNEATRPKWMGLKKGDHIVLQPSAAFDEKEREWVLNDLGLHKTDLAGDTSDLTWMRFHDPAEPMFALGAYIDGRMVGIAHYLFHRSAWTPGDYCYLQDLFVAEGARKAGLGRALIEAVYKEARAAGASRVHWLTHETNATARSLYDTLADRPGFIQYRKLF